MHHSEYITVLDDKIRITEQQLAPLGISDQSICWAKWLPNRRSKSNGSLQHLVVSPFEVNAWPFLFRIVLALDDSKPGTLASALDVLKKESINILSIDGSRAGHSHSMISIIGEAASLKNDGKIIEFEENLNDADRRFDNEKTNDFVHGHFVPQLLKFGDDLRKTLYLANRERDFLRSTFVFDKHKGVRRGTLFDPNLLENSQVKKLALDQCEHAVQCVWLQNHAFFWLYGVHSTEEKTLRFDAKNRCLRPNDRLLGEYFSNARSLGAPFKTVAAIDYKEQYLRLVLSKLDRGHRTFRSILSYAAKYDDRKDTKGLLSQVVDVIAESSLTIQGINMTTKARSLQSEDGRFSILVSPSEPPSDVAHGSVQQEISNILSEALNAATINLKSISGCDIIADFPVVSPFAPKTLFLSTNFDWLDKDRPGLQKLVVDCAAKHGFLLILGHPDKLPQDLRHKWDTQAPITQNVLNLLRNCDAFLQIIPQIAIQAHRDENKLKWLLFESGAAHGLRIPCTICVDKSTGFHLSEWSKHLGAGIEKTIFQFSGAADDAVIASEIEKAIESLSLVPRPIRKSRHWRQE